MKFTNDDLQGFATELRGDFHTFSSQYLRERVEKIEQGVHDLYYSYDFSTLSPEERTGREGIQELFCMVHTFMTVTMPSGETTTAILRDLENLFVRAVGVPDFARAVAEQSAEAFQMWSAAREIPAMQFEGEVELCSDPWHQPTKQEIESP
jgi:tetrahydromethanopterin S-methyltransferase subunit B